MLLNSGWAFTSSKILYAECTSKGLIFNVVSSAEIMSSKYFAGKAFPVFLGYILFLGTSPYERATVLSVRAWHATSITRPAKKVVAGLPLLYAVKGGSNIEPPKSVHRQRHANGVHVAFVNGLAIYLKKTKQMQMQELKQDKSSNQIARLGE